MANGNGLITDKHPVARKAHRCDICHTDIEPGTRYRRSLISWEGSLATFIEHEECARVGQRSYDQWLDDGYTDEHVQQHLTDVRPEDRDDDERIVAARIWPDEFDEAAS